jgi:hypothetical protein
VTGATDRPLPYKVVYSEQVRAELVKLVQRAARAGLGQVVLNAVKEIDARLRIYPQFGEPLRDLGTPGETLWTGTVPPLALHYIVDNERRLVFVVQPFRLLPHVGL